jgi:hypothetical protein
VKLRERPEVAFGIKALILLWVTLGILVYLTQLTT